MDKVLVVDDEVDICVLLSRHLQKYGAKADYALTIADAVSMATEYEYNLYIIDLNLAGASGYDLIAKLKKMKHEAKIIMISAHDGEATNAIHNGADYFLAKPLSIDSIKKALEYVQFTN
jgi:DNA-binding response OmpR family regulator